MLQPLSLGQLRRMIKRPGAIRDNVGTAFATTVLSVDVTVNNARQIITHTDDRLGTVAIVTTFLLAFADTSFRLVMIQQRMFSRVLTS